MVEYLDAVEQITKNLMLKFIRKVGGTVLPPFLVGGTGLRAIKGNRRTETKAFGYVFDEDISAALYLQLKLSLIYL